MAGLTIRGFSKGGAGLTSLPVRCCVAASSTSFWLRPETSAAIAPPLFRPSARLARSLPVKTCRPGFQAGFFCPPPSGQQRREVAQAADDAAAEIAESRLVAIRLFRPEGENRHAGTDSRRCPRQ